MSSSESRPSLDAWNPIESGNLSSVGLLSTREFAVAELHYTTRRETWHSRLRVEVRPHTASSFWANMCLDVYIELSRAY